MDNNTPAETYISKLKVRDRLVYIKLEWIENENDLFHIKIIDGDSSWSGRFSDDAARDFRENCNIDETKEQYSSNVKKCLMEENENYEYDFSIADNDGDTNYFIWKRRFKTVTVIHGKVKVDRDDIPESKDSLLDILLKKNYDLRNEMQQLNSKTNCLNEELDKCKEELEKFVNIKVKLETSLYGKFVQLLNTKKRRIQLLEDNLLNFEEPNNISSTGDLD